MSKHSRSILQPQDDNEAKCFLTGSWYNLQRHHIFNGPARDWSEKNGCWVWLRADVHDKIHHVGKYRRVMYWLKAVCQQKWEEIHAEDYDHKYDSARDQFIHEVGKNYEQYLRQ